MELLRCANSKLQVADRVVNAISSRLKKRPDLGGSRVEKSNLSFVELVSSPGSSTHHDLKHRHVCNCTDDGGLVAHIGATAIIPVWTCWRHRIYGARCRGVQTDGH